MQLSRRRRVVGAVAVCAALGLATIATAGSPTIDGPARATEAAERVPPPPTPGAGEPVLLISDSAWLGIYLYGGGLDAVQGFEHSFALASCRRRIVRSCINFDGSVPIPLLAELNANPGGFGTLFVSTGYNDSDVRFRTEVDTIMTRARTLGYQRVIWLTLRANVTYVSPDLAGFAEVYRTNNRTIVDIAAAGTYPELFIANWANYARDRPAWFSPDGIHLRQRGGYAAGDYVSRKLAFLDQRACPQPLAAGQAPLDPCPDPDAQGPVVDLDSLYPVDAPQPRNPFLLDVEASSSWPGPPWWAS